MHNYNAVSCFRPLALKGRYKLQVSEKKKSAEMNLGQ